MTVSYESIRSLESSRSRTEVANCKISCDYRVEYLNNLRGICEGCNKEYSAEICEGCLPDLF